jgi:two-component system, chemotaxis family, CheB/CheR fusion protein
MMESVVLASERAADLTRQLLAYAGKGRFFVQPTDVSQLVRAISSLIQSSIPKKVDLRLDLHPHLPMVEADPAQIQQLVMNLVINGAEAIGEERTGTVTVSTLLDPSGESVVIQVDDDGCGMDESVRSRIFDPFFTTKFTGRGLGLAAALGIVRGHHGEIRIDSAPGMGTLFEVRLPAKGARVPQVKDSPKQRELRGAGEVLVIDDEELVRQMAQSTLERYGYTVTLASDGREGVELFRARAGKTSLVLLDMMMPVMGGDEALEEIRSISPNVPVIGSSGYSEVTAKERFGERGLAAFLQKPYSAQELADCVKSVIESRVILGGAAG